MKKYHSILITCLVLIVIVLSCVGCTKKAEKNQTVEGSYHTTDANGNKRGSDVTVSLEKDAISAIIVNQNKDYPTIDPTAMMSMWTVKGNTFIKNLSSMSIADIMKIEVTCDTNGMPTAITGITEEWVPNGSTDCAGLLILALQNALDQK